MDAMKKKKHNPCSGVALRNLLGCALILCSCMLLPGCGGRGENISDMDWLAEAAELEAKGSTETGELTRRIWLYEMALNSDGGCESWEREQIAVKLERCRILYFKTCGFDDHAAEIKNLQVKLNNLEERNKIIERQYNIEKKENSMLRESNAQLSALLQKAQQDGDKR